MSHYAAHRQTRVPGGIPVEIARLRSLSFAYQKQNFNAEAGQRHILAEK